MKKYKIPENIHEFWEENGKFYYTQKILTAFNRDGTSEWEVDTKIKELKSEEEK